MLGPLPVRVLFILHTIFHRYSEQEQKKTEALMTS